MARRPSRGVTSGIGRPMKIAGRDGDLTIRKTHGGKILYVKDSGEWHQLTTGIDVAQLKKDVDRLINSVNTLRNENNPYPNKRSLTLSSSDGTSMSLKNDSGGLLSTMDSDSGAKTFKINRNINDGNPTLQIGSSDAECLQILTSYDSGAKGMDYAEIGTKSASAGTDKGIIKFKVDEAQILQLDDAGVDITGTLSTTGIVTITSAAIAKFKIAYDGSNYAVFNTNASGDLKISTTGAGTTDSDITLDADGDIILEAAGGDITADADIKLAATKKVYLDGGTDTYIFEFADDHVRFMLGDNNVLALTESSTGNVVSFNDSAAGWVQNEPTYNASDTEVNFHTRGNKQFLTFGAGNITDLNLNFPNLSCNCILLIKQDGSGSRAITNYKTFDQAGGNEATVLFAGGSNPTLTTTANKVDILSFYWDNDNHVAYGTATHNF